MAGIGDATVCNTVIEVFQSIVNNLWTSAVASIFPKTENEFREAMITMEEHSQSACALGAIEGCHIPLKCPPGGQQSQKKRYNFKGFYLIVLMAIVNAKYEFTWASYGYTGNNHDSSIFQATNIYTRINNDTVLPHIAKLLNETDFPPLLLGDGAFPFHTWFMKPCSNAVLSIDQKYFNYRLKERASGRLKGRWRVLQRKCECNKDAVKSVTLACIELHNLCILLGDISPHHWDINLDPETNKMRPRDIVRELLQMRKCMPAKDSSKEAVR